MLTDGTRSLRIARNGSAVDLCGWNLGTLTVTPSKGCATPVGANPFVRLANEADGIVPGARDATALRPAPDGGAIVLPGWGYKERARKTTNSTNPISASTTG